MTDLCPKLTPAERGFFERVQDARGIIAHLLFERAPRALPTSIVLDPEGRPVKTFVGPVTGAEIEAFIDSWDAD